MHYRAYAEELIKMKDLDLQVRQRLANSGELFNGYNKEMERVHIRNANRLESIIQEIGWPTKSKVRQEARDAAMIIVQHAISLPEFQKKCIQYIEQAVIQGQEDKKNYAFLYDRICFNERRPQKFGTQYDWDSEGKMSPWTIENIENINALRKEFGLNTIEEETNAIRSGMIQGGENPPLDFKKRQEEILEWSKKTGWIK